MNKADLVGQVSARRDASRKSTARIVDELIDAIGRALTDGRRVELRRFGAFDVRRRKARTMRNPRSGELFRVAAKIVPFFRTSRTLVSKIAGERDRS